MSKDLMVRSSSAEFLIFERQNHEKGIQVRFEEGDLWLTQKSIGELFNTTRNNITMHINDIYNSYELDSNSTSKYFLLVQKEGDREVKRNVLYYNLDMIIALGYRVQSDVAVRFRIWATKLLHEYIQKGFAMDDERLKQGGNRYFRELLQRILSQHTKSLRMQKKVENIKLEMHRDISINH